MQTDKYVKYLLGVYAVIWTLLAINPVYREDWFLENILVFVFVPFLVWSYRKFRLSKTSYTLIFVFMASEALISSAFRKA